MCPAIEFHLICYTFANLKKKYIKNSDTNNLSLKNVSQAWLAFSTHILNYATESYAKTYKFEAKKNWNNFCMYAVRNYKKKKLKFKTQLNIR